MRYLKILMLTIIPLQLWAYELQIDSSYTDEASDNFNWKAQWIWMEPGIQHEVMLARKTFVLAEVPKKASLRITATSQYQLFINGKYIRRGPARSAPHHQYYDVLDVTDHLSMGSNTLSIRVHYQHGAMTYESPARAGLLGQLDISLKTTRTQVITDASWKVTADSSWTPGPRISRFQLIVNDQADMRKKINNWNTNSFDDSSWSNATVLMRETGWPAPQPNAAPQALTPPWTSLMPRDLPLLQEIEMHGGDLIKAGNIKTSSLLDPGELELSSSFSIPLSEVPEGQIAKQLRKFHSDKQPLVIPETDTEESYFLLFDLGEVFNGFPQLDIVGPSGTVVHILCAPYMLDDNFSPYVVDSKFLDKIILSGEKDEWESTYFKPVRYIGLLIRRSAAPTKIQRVGIRRFEYPFKDNGYIRSSEAAWVEQYMQASAKTIKVCTTDGYTDNYRERRQYAQTGYYAALGNYWLFGDHHLQRRYLLQVANEQQANGIMPAYAPLADDDYMVILDSNCLWIRSLRNYLLFSGDKNTVEELLPSARKLMELLHSFTIESGLLYNPPYPYWLDHAKNDRRGANFCLNGHYLGALEDFAEILSWTGEENAEIYVKRAILLRESLQNLFWEEKKGLFSDAWIEGARSNQYSEHANGMALAMEVATETQASSIAEKILEDDKHDYINRASGMTMVTPAMSYFLHLGLCKYGFLEESFNLFQNRFDKMLGANTNNTLWEEWWLDGTGRSGVLQKGRTRSDAQTESAFSPALFAEYLMGIKVLKPGLDEVEIFLPLSNVNKIEGSIPSPHGNLQVKWDLNQNGRGELKVKIPGTMRAKLNLQSLDLPKDQPIYLNGTPLSTALQEEPYLILKNETNIKF